MLCLKCDNFTEQYFSVVLFLFVTSVRYEEFKLFLTKVSLRLTVRMKSRQNKERRVSLTWVRQDFFCGGNINEHFLGFFLIIAFVMVRVPLHS